MKRVTINVTDEVAQAVEAYVHEQPVPTTFRSVLEVALTEFLRHRGYLGRDGPLRITPAPTGSGHTDTSVDHDCVSAGQ